MATTAGILTLSASDNCGSLLQTYALQSVLELRYGVQVQVIDFDSLQSRNMYSVFPPSLLQCPKKALLGLLFYRQLCKQKRDYNGFREKFLHMTPEKYPDAQALKVLDGHFDFLFTGSDQVWNIHMQDFDDSFLLGWVKKSRKIAYAPSFGCNDFTAYRDQKALKENLLSYTALSTREAGGRRAIEAVTGKTVPILADPTLLVTREAWNALAGDPLVREDYIFFYSWAYDNYRLNGIVTEYARQHNLKVFVINASRWLRHKPSEFGFTLYPDGGPWIFLNLMKHAKKVFVESFHGVIFANTFCRDFYYLDNHTDGTLDPRLDSILTLYDRKDRVVRKLEDIRPEPIDYSTDTPANRELVERSFAYLDGIFAEEVLPL